MTNFHQFNSTIPVQVENLGTGTAIGLFAEEDLGPIHWYVFLDSTKKLISVPEEKITKV